MFYVIENWVIDENTYVRLKSFERRELAQQHIRFELHNRTDDGSYYTAFIARMDEWMQVTKGGVIFTDETWNNEKG